MPEIQLLTQETIDKIAAGEVVERPSSVVKELVENALDAGASAITVEIKDGGTSLIRITDNGCGIAHSQVPLAFLRHSTSKIRSIEDLMCVSSLGFRGEALSSISAVSRVELITKTPDSLTGTRYRIEGSKEIANEEIGAPDGTTFLVRDLFYNTPARRKFLKTAATEGSYVYDIVEKLALSHPDVSFKYIQNNQTKLHSSGSGNVKDLIYHIYGREIAAALLPVDIRCPYFDATGFIGKPVISRGNRNFENYYINGRYVKSNLIAKSIEDAYKKFLMQHQYPFTVLYFTFHGDIDVNVHPTKMEMRFSSSPEVYSALFTGLQDLLSHREMIPVVPVSEAPAAPQKAPVYKEPVPEPFEQKRLNDLRRSIAKDSPYEYKYPQRRPETAGSAEPAAASTAVTASRPSATQIPPSGPQTTPSGAPAAAQPEGERPKVVTLNKRVKAPSDLSFRTPDAEPAAAAAPQSGNSSSGYMGLSEFFRQQKKTVVSEDPSPAEKQQTLADYQPDFMTKDARKRHKIIGQLFKTYWLVEYEDMLFILDQHAAHEKVLYERTMKRLKEKELTSQVISPPIVLTLDPKEIDMLNRYRAQLERIGYEIDHFGGKDYMITAVPDNLFHVDMRDLFIEMLDDFSGITGRETPELILEKIASMSCKAAVKGNSAMSLPEIEALFDELMELDNPYNCPHGRPTIITMTKYEIEKKFKRIV